MFKTKRYHYYHLISIKTKLIFLCLLKQLIFQPDAEQCGKFFESINNEFKNSLKKCPRLIKQLELEVTTPLNEYFEMIDDDNECSKWQMKIQEEMIKNKAALNAYQEQWMPFAYIWQSDKETVMNDFGNNEINIAHKFDLKIQELRILTTKVSMRDVSRKVHFMVVDAVKLRKMILTEIDDWKCQYLLLLKQKTFDKITNFFNYTSESGETVLIVPKSVGELRTCCSTYDRLRKEIDSCKCILNDLNEQFDVLYKYGVPINGEFAEMKEDMHEQWDAYLRKLNDAEEILNNAKDSFKLTLESERITPDFF